MKKDIVFISGRPRSGKSTLIKRIIEKLSSREISGIITPEFREGEERKGFFIQDLKTRKREILASVDIKSKQRVGKYGVSVEGMEKILDLFLENFQNSDICIIDEVGPMELKSRKFKEIIEKVLECDKFCLITLHRNLVSKYRDKGKIFWLERENFDEVEQEVIKLARHYI